MNALKFVSNQKHQDSADAGNQSVIVSIISINPRYERVDPLVT